MKDERPTEAQVTLRVAAIHRESLRELLDTVPGVKYWESGWIEREFRIVAAPDVMAELQPRLKAWEADCVSRDAW